MTKARRQQLVLGLSGISLTWAASIVLELLLLEFALVALGATTVLALVVAVVLTRRLLAPHRRAMITVGDLRGRLQRR
ncbi:MAG: hypothetical protein AB7T31_03750 [Gemmatimonadales bacterium]